jgi:hypothetical protein
MGLINSSEHTDENRYNDTLWYRSWLSINVGGVVFFTLIMVLVSTIGAFITYTKHDVHKEQREEVKKILEEVKKIYFLEEQYQYTLNAKEDANLRNQYKKFNQPTSFSEMKTYLKKWQTDLRIKTINVTMEAEKVYDRGKNITLIPIRFTVHLQNDKMLYQLLEKLQNEIPGHIVIKHIDVKRMAGMSPETIDQLLIDKTNSFIEGTVACDWFFIGTHEQ